MWIRQGEERPIPSESTGSWEISKAQADLPEINDLTDLLPRLPQPPNRRRPKYPLNNLDRSASYTVVRAFMVHRYRHGGRAIKTQRQLEQQTTVPSKAADQDAKRVHSTRPVETNAPKIGQNDSGTSRPAPRRAGISVLPKQYPGQTARSMSTELGIFSDLPQRIGHDGWVLGVLSGVTVESDHALGYFVVWEGDFEQQDKKREREMKDGGREAQLGWASLSPGTAELDRGTGLKCADLSLREVI